MRPLKYETLRQELNAARDAAQERSDHEELEAKQKASRIAPPDQDREKAKAQAEYEFNVESHKRYLTQLAAYQSRQTDELARAQRAIETERLLKANDPREYGRLLNDKRRKAERDDHERRVKQAWQERVEGQSDRSDGGREFKDATREQAEKKWVRALSGENRQDLSPGRDEIDRADR